MLWEMEIPKNPIFIYLFILFGGGVHEKKVFLWVDGGQSP